jgi:DNA-directed RNA polymerase specialized sigma24 family protein
MRPIERGQVATPAASFSDDEVRRSFEEEWPELARRLEHFLAAKGVERWLRADVIQETAARLYPRWETLDHSLPLWNLAATIAVRVVHNHRRKESRIELVADLVPIHRDDVHVRGLQRAQLDKTRSALQQLTTDQRRVLLAEVGEALLPAGSRNRINVLRLRARARLRETLGPWAPSAITIRLRYLRARVAQKRSTLEMHMPAMGNSLVNVAMTATLGLAGAAGTAVDSANPMPPDRAPLLSLAQLRQVHLDPIAHIRHQSSDVSRFKPRADRTDEPPPGFVDGTGDWVEDQNEEVEGQRKTAEDHMKEWAEDQKKAAEDHMKEWAEDQKKAAEDQAEQGKEEVEEGKEWAEDQLP